jgi:hypothetical protein
MSKHTYFFTHDFNAHQDEKITLLLMELGYEAYGLYWRILEQLAQASDNKLKANVKLLAYAFNYNGDATIIDSLIHDFNLFCLEDEFFYSPSLNFRLSKLTEMKKKKSEAGKKGVIAKALIKQNSSTPQALLKHNSSTPQALLKHCLSIPQANFSIEQNRIEEDRTEQNKIEEDRIEKEKGRCQKDDSLHSFQIWWNVYDKKTGKEKTFAKWKKLKQETQLKCLEVVEKYVRITPDKKFRKNPTTYLNGSHWQDEIEIPKEIMTEQEAIDSFLDNHTLPGVDS